MEFKVKSIFGLIDPVISEISPEDVDIDKISFIAKASEASYLDHINRQTLEIVEDTCNEEGIEWEAAKFSFHHGFQYGMKVGVIYDQLSGGGSKDTIEALKRVAEATIGKVEKMNELKGVRHCQITVDKDNGKAYITVDGNLALFVSAISVEYIEA